ncbi:O-antigen ligase family protein [Sporosalibacterium faouarense]|uniref:O-antigen ligase family protein n=1 Tax=Sporosalibacterium faouarense TaxID=516123 RepID=UPI00192AC5A1|nr:O-antigen ligase family protein [Sporosalibacterium faouarense]
MNKIRPKIKYDEFDDRKISVALVAPFVILTLQYFLLINLGVIGTSGATGIQFFSKLLVGVSFIYTLPSVIRRSSFKLIIVYLVSIIIFGVHYLMYPENQIYMRSLIIPIFLMSLPMFVFSMSIRNLKIFKIIMIKSSFIIFLAGIILGIQSLGGSANVGTYSGPLANYMLIPTIVFLNQLIDRFNIKSLLITTLSILVILILGSRGAILGIVFFIFMKFLLSHKVGSYKKLFIYFSAIFVAMISAINFDKIISRIFQFLSDRGIYSRTIYLFMQDNIHLSGRNYIYRTVINEIVQNPIIGFGIAGDRRVLNGDAVYAHNIILEILGNFGIPIGFILLVMIILLITKTIIKRKTLRSEITLIWLSLGFIHLMVSSSYLIEMKFWILMGLIIGSIRSCKFTSTARCDDKTLNKHILK